MNKLFESSKADGLQGALNVSRRGFLVTTSTLGAGLALGMTTRPAASSSMPLDEVNAWVHIATDDTVTIRIARSEMGQGTLTGLAQLVAEELDCDWTKLLTNSQPLGRMLPANVSGATTPPAAAEGCVQASSMCARVVPRPR